MSAIIMNVSRYDHEEEKAEEKRIKEEKVEEMDLELINNGQTRLNKEGNIESILMYSGSRKNGIESNGRNPCLQ